MAKGQRSFVYFVGFCNLCRGVIAKEGFVRLGMETIRRHRRNRESKFIFDSLFSRRTLLLRQSLL